MSDISRVALFGKLNALGYKAIESATVFCKLRGNPFVEIEHWFAQILQLPDSDLHRIVRSAGIDEADLARDLTRALDRLPRGATSISDLSTHVESAVERAWVYGTLKYGDSQIRTGYLLVAMLKSHESRSVLLGISRQFDRIHTEQLADDLLKIVGGSPEDGQRASDGSMAVAPGEASGAMAPAEMGRQEALKRFAVDLTERARRGELDPVRGRDEEVRQIVDILMRRRQNNPIVTGEAGVGKTAVVEGFAQRIAAGDVPPPLRGVTLMTLDVGLLQAGASMKGEFENRLRQVIDEVQSSPRPIILFIDEAHTLIGAGGAAGTGDAANLLKPALARGTLRTIAATTWSEYKKYIEKDPALSRRFQVVQVLEPSEEKAILMSRGVASTLEKHHRVQLLDAGIEAAVHLSHRYIPARQLPDKAVSLLDTACARVAISQHATPAEVEDSQRRIEALETELEIIGREDAIGFDVGERRAKADKLLAAERDRMATLQRRWEQEKSLVDAILDLRARLRADGRAVDEAKPAPAAAGGAASAVSRAKEPVASSAKEPVAPGAKEPVAPGAPTPAQRSQWLVELRDKQAQLVKVQGERPLILPTVDDQAVAAVVAEWTGIPVGRMVRNEIESVLHLADTLNGRIVGQRHGLEMIARRIQTSRARLDNPNKPIGVFMLAGPSGVGKTEAALALAEALYGGEQNVITINMSEFQEAHTVSTLKGAPPGYVGYGEGGVLTEAVRRRPYSVVLLDELEKAHHDVHELFFQVFDKGWMEDAEGRYINFKNTIIIITTNVGTDTIMNLCRDPALRPDPEALAKELRQPLLKVFPPALLGRLVVIPFYPLSDETLSHIVRLQLDRIKRRLRESHGVPFDYEDSAVKLVVGRCTEVESGGRMIDTILTNTVLPRISVEYLERLARGEPLKRVTLAARDGDFRYEFG